MSLLVHKTYHASVPGAFTGTVTIPATTAGNTLVVCAAATASFRWDGFEDGLTITDNSGDTFVEGYTDVSDGGTGGAVTVAIWYSKNIAGGATTVSFDSGDTSGVGAPPSLWIYELQGNCILTDRSLNDDGYTSVNPVDGGELTSPVANTFYVTVIAASDSGANTLNISSVSAGWTLDTTSENLNTWGTLGAAYIDGGTGSQTASFTLNGNAEQYCGTGVSFCPFQTVNTTTFISVSDNKVGVQFVISASVQPQFGASPTGSLQFSIDGVNAGSPVALSGGGAYVLHTFVNVSDAGAHTYGATYIPDAGWNASSTNGSANTIVALIAARIAKMTASAPGYYAGGSLIANSGFTLNCTAAADRLTIPANGTYLVGASIDDWYSDLSDPGEIRVNGVSVASVSGGTSAVDAMVSLSLNVGDVIQLYLNSGAQSGGPAFGHLWMAGPSLQPLTTTQEILTGYSISDHSPATGTGSNFQPAHGSGATLTTPYVQGLRFLQTGIYLAQGTLSRVDNGSPGSKGITGALWDNFDSSHGFSGNSMSGSGDPTNTRSTSVQFADLFYVTNIGDGSLFPVTAIGWFGNSSTTSPGHTYTATNTLSDVTLSLVSVPPPPIFTTTTVVGAPNPVNPGTPVTYTATVTPASGGTPTGSVQFKDGGVNIGSPVALSAGHAAVGKTYTDLTDIGDHSISAVYIPDAGWGASTGYTTETVSKIPTVTVVVSLPGTVSVEVPITFTATATPNYGRTLTGGIQFADNGVNIGTPVTLVNNIASTEYLFTDDPANHVITATYVPDPYWLESSGNTTVPVTNPEAFFSLQKLILTIKQNPQPVRGKS